MSILISCNSHSIPAEFSFLENSHREQLQRLFEYEDYSSRFVIMESLIQNIYSQDGIDELRSFIQQYTMYQSDDPFTSYYMLLLGDYYSEENSELGAYYYSRLLQDHSDVLVDGYSMHYRALNALLSIISDPATRIRYYEQLIEDFSDQIDMGVSWYLLAQEYRKDGRYEEYFDALEQFMAYPGTEVAGVPDIEQRVREELAFHYNSRKDWTSASLDTLVANIRYALNTRNPARLERYRAKENFFTMSWLQETSDVNARPPNFDLANFLIPGRTIRYSELNMLNEREAYLPTRGWGYRITNWYFYFRKIDYPADPEIHGNWEWAGIYFGDSI